MDTKGNDIENLRKGLHTAFIDGTYNSNLAYKPEFISNDYKYGKKVLVSIEQELAHCEEFLSVLHLSQRVALRRFCRL